MIRGSGANQQAPENPARRETAAPYFSDRIAKPSEVPFVFFRGQIENYIERTAQMSAYILEVKGITKTFPGVRALGNVSFHVLPGEVHGLIGENGAGKSTLLKIINGVYAYGSYEGEIWHNGELAKYKSPHDALEKGIGFVPQEINVMDDLTVAENIFVGHLNDHKVRFSMREMQERCKTFLQENKFNLDAKAAVAQLSIGQKQLLMVAKALSWNPSILILDEPTTALSHSDVDNLFEIIRHLKGKGTSIIFVTHKLDEIFEMTDRVTILRDGQMITTYSKEEYDRGKIIAGMVGRELSQLYPARSVVIGEEVLRVEHLTVPHPRIQNKNLIEDVSFHLRKGEVLGLVGLVGAGRTETVTTIFGGYPGYTGSIYINGEKVRIRTEADAIKNGLNMLTEDRKSNGLLLLNDIKVNIVVSDIKKILSRNTRLVSRKNELACAENFMKKLRIKAPSSASMVANLSGGNQQKVVLAKALHSEPKILILDEPTKGIDVGSKQEIYEIMNELLEEGMSIIMVSSELPEVLGMSDRFVIMSEGKIVGEMTKAEATQEKLMAACFS